MKLLQETVFVLSVVLICGTGQGVCVGSSPTASTNANIDHAINITHQHNVRGPPTPVLDANTMLPFSFVMDGVKYVGGEGVPLKFVPPTANATVVQMEANNSGWHVDCTTTVTENNSTIIETVYTHSLTGIQVSRTTTNYNSLGSVSETVLSFRNVAATTSCHISNINLLDMSMPGLGAQPELRSFKGSSASRFDYQPLPVIGLEQKNPNTNIHGDGGNMTVREGVRLWTASSSVIPNQTESSCVAACANLTSDVCIGVTFSHLPQSGVNACYIINPPLLRWDEEPGFASWTKLPPNTSNTNTFGPRAGRSSDPFLPYFALTGADVAMAVSVGWSGNWIADASYTQSTQQPQLIVAHPFVNTTLDAGAEFRTMRVVSVAIAQPSETHGKRRSSSSSSWSSSSSSSSSSSATPTLTSTELTQLAFNRHRKFMLKFKLPRDPVDDTIKGAIIASWSWIGWSSQDETTQLWHVQAVKNSSVEYFWLDAGWFNGGFPDGVGNWQIPLSATVDPKEYPQQTLAPLGQLAHTSPNRVGFVTWFEPERVSSGTYIHLTFPEYLLSLSATTIIAGDEGEGEGEGKGEGKGGATEFLFDLGNEEAREFMFEYLSEAVTEYSLDVLRIDFNIDPGPYWSSNDRENRTGMREIMYITGLYALWDKLLITHPHLLIDDCSSGGRRIDVETLSRSFPLWRSDYPGQNDPTSLQSMSMGLSQFAPVSSGAVWDVDPYTWRSAGVVGKTISWGETKWRAILASPPQLSLLKQAVNETQELRHVALSGDYYPLTNGTQQASVIDWAAYQFDVDGSEGFAFYFRNSNTSDTTMISQLKRLAPASTYSVTLFYTYDQSGEAQTMTGEQLSQMTITLSAPPASLLLKYTLI